MKDLLVGSTGFVGGNLIDEHKFEGVCNSTDIDLYYHSNPELCIYAGIPSAMFLANSNPDVDFEIMKAARENIKQINPEKIVLISTIAVYDTPKEVNEESKNNMDGLSAYGRNRLQLENWIREDWADGLIVRLPALYGKGLKKNFLFDLHSIVPSVLKKEKYVVLSKESELVEKGYLLSDNYFYKLDAEADMVGLRYFFEQNSFNALSFTDSRSRFQFYNLNRLWGDLRIALKYGIRTLNIVTPPVEASEVYRYVMGQCDWVNEMDGRPLDYDVKSIYAEKFGGHDGYLITKEQELDDVKSFMGDWT